MTALASDPAGTTNREGTWVRFSGLAFLVLFVALFVFMVTGPGVYDGSTLEDYAAAHSDTDRVDRLSFVVVGLAPLAGAALLVTGSFLRRQLERATGQPTVATQITTVGAAVSAIGFTIAAAAAGAAAHVATGPSDGGFPADSVAGYSLDLFASLVLTVSVWGLSMLLLGVAATARRTGQLPTWMVWVAFVAGPLLPVAWLLAMIPMLVAMLWIPAACLMITDS